jgi:chromosome segregation ATPase
LRGQTTRADILTEQLAGAQQELGVLHAHLADLEHARAALDEELREQIARADTLTEQLTVSRWKPRTVAARHVTVRPTTTSDAEGSQPLPDSSEGIRKMRRVCLFSFYDAQGIVDDYVVFFSRN